jgi:hypothetical protein
MKTIVMQEWEDLEHISKLANESPARALKLVNTGIGEKAAILLHKNFGIRLGQSLLALKDSYLHDVLQQMLQHSIIDQGQALQIMRYKRLLNARGNPNFATSMKDLCTDGMLILANL